MPHLRTSGSVTKLTLIGDEYDLRLGPPIFAAPGQVARSLFSYRRLCPLPDL